jgi:hypothetical protein
MKESIHVQYRTINAHASDGKGAQNLTNLEVRLARATVSRFTVVMRC